MDNALKSTTPLVAKRWRVANGSPEHRFMEGIIADIDGHGGALVACTIAKVNHHLAEADAIEKRIEACHNACIGMDDPAAEIAALCDTSRHFNNIQQDLCEGALVPVSLFDAVCQALAEVKPDHPALKQASPSYGTWAALRMENERLRRYVGNNLLRSDYRSADHMRATIDGQQAAVRVLVDALAGRINNTEYQPRVLEWLAPDAVRNNPIAWAAVQEWIASRPAE